MFPFNLLLQIYEWCQYQKRTCSTSSEDVFSNYFLSGPCSNEDQPMEMIEGALKASSTVELDSITLENMKGVYQSEIEEYRVLCQTYHQEKEKARRQRRLRGFPPFERWVPEGRTLNDKEQELLVGPSSTAMKVSEYVYKERGRRPHKFQSTKSVICQVGLPSYKFGIVKKIILQTFAGCQYVWLLNGWYPPPNFHDESRIWFSEDKIEETSAILISRVSKPLVIAKEENLIWFLDAPIIGIPEQQLFT